MCGIFGYIGDNKNAPKLVLDSLKRLEYRGYDSWGVGVSRRNSIVLDKHTGKIGNAKTKLKRASLAFGHTRWATHGGVTTANAHPHCDCTKRLAVVHNGVIENYWEIKQKLEKKHRLVSDTDTELMAHLIEDRLKKQKLSEAVRKAFLQLKGLSAFVVMDSQSDQLVAIKNGSPLVIGLGKGENYISSDANCLLPLTRKVIYLADGQMVVVSKKQVKISQVSSGKTIKVKPETINWSVTEAKKGRYPHFMAKEIHEQPKVIRNLKNNFENKVAELATAIKAAKKVYLVGCGTAGYAAVASSYLLGKISDVESVAVAGSEFNYKEKFISKDSLVIFFSQSGETIDIVKPLKRLNSGGIKTVGVVNVTGSTLYRLADIKVPLEAGQEICVLSTKAFTAMLTVLGLVSYHIAGKTSVAKKDLTRTLSELKTILTKDYQDKYLDPVVDYLVRQPNIYGIGRGLSFPMIMEAALKIKEVSYIHMEGFASGELKHGVIALIDKGTACMTMAPNNETYDLVLSGAMEIKSRGGYIVGLSHKNNPIFDAYVPITDSGEFTMLSNVVIAQLIAYKMALHKGYDPDKPRNLAKSVTVV